MTPLNLIQSKSLQSKMSQAKSLVIAATILGAPLLVQAEEIVAVSGPSNLGMRAIAAAIVLGAAAVAGTTAQGRALTSAMDSIGRNPASSGPLFIPLLIGLALIESLVVLAFVIALSFT
jgi:F-type H+-transporting ATPase subunit c